MKRAITIISAFVVAALLTVAAQATSREGQSLELREKGREGRLESSETPSQVSRVESLGRSGVAAVTGYGNTSQ